LPKLDHFDFEVTVLSGVCMEFNVKYISEKGIHLATYCQNLEARKALERFGEMFKDKNPSLFRLSTAKER